MPRLAPGRPGQGVLLAAVLVAGAAGMVVAEGVPALTESPKVRVLTPSSGAEVGEQFLLSWTGSGFPSYAVVVDQALPRPGASARPGRNVVVVEANAVRLTLGPRSGGSPSARRHHTVVVVPLDEDGRRVGEQAAVVQVRSRA